jgi:photosystem II stability/assembly factor-like uncharacterized protein
LRPYVYQTTDYGQTWRFLTSGFNGIPADRFVLSVSEDGEQPGTIYALTGVGRYGALVYVSRDDGRTWVVF